ncbi:MAG TPA: hypothetical protein VL691_18900 [Vicinamibacteria bacterium]|nr:hypothetical protein [Vicinamibacteria bacterium]
MRDNRCTLALMAASVLCAAGSLFAQPSEPPPRPFLRKVIQLDDQKLAAIEKGEVVTKPLATTDKPEIAAFGVVKTAGTPDLLLRLAKDIKRFRQVPQIPQMGLFSNPPKLDDLKGLTHPPDDIGALKRCKPGSCDVKLGTAALEKVAKLDWKTADAEAQASALMNQMIVDFVTAYQQGGTDAMGTIMDKKAPKTRTEEYKTLLAHSPYLPEYLKEFNDYLGAYPKGKLADTEDILYWTRDEFGLKPVISVYHLTLHREPRGALIANKMLAASHFFNASLEMLVGVPTSDGKGMYLMSLARTRIDPPTGMLGGVLMGKVRDGVETAVRENLKVARERLAAAAK